MASNPHAPAGREMRLKTLTFTGDVMLGRLVNEVLMTEDARYPWGDVLPLLRESDLLLVNLECAITAHQGMWGRGVVKPFYFRSDPKNVAVLQEAGVSFASLANNHALDFEVEGLRETLALLDAAGIAHAGAGESAAAAATPARLAAGGLRVAVVAFADHPEEWAATERSPGLNYTPITLEPRLFAKVERALAAAREGADLVVASFHWGPNMRDRPTQAFRDFARDVIDAGADVFWGHSAHVVQGIEWRDGKLILYDTGDFVDDYAVHPDLRNDLGALFLVRVEDARLTGLELVPVLIAREQLNVARGAERELFSRRFATLCADLGTAVVLGPERIAVPAAARPAERGPVAQA